jgi:putative transposase
MDSDIRRRNLPHIYPPSVPIFLTWRLHGSLPRQKSEVCAEGKAKIPTPGDRFRRMDRGLDAHDHGPTWLALPEIAEMVCAEIEAGGRGEKLYLLHEFVVMPNHVHMLVSSRGDMARVMQMVKGRTAQKANAMLGRTGKRFWQAESFDHWCRSVEQMRRIREYIAMNPVKARLATKPEMFAWGSAGRRRRQVRDKV